MSVETHDIVEFAISELYPHPRQADFFTELSAVELAELAEDLATRGQQTPISVLSGGMIVCGHQRVRAARSLGWETIYAYVLDTEEDMDETKVVDALISDNIVGRQNDRITLARCYDELASRWRTEYPDEDGEMRDVLAAKLDCGLSGRQLDRLRQLLKLPKDIVDRIASGLLKQDHGHRLLKMTDNDREQAIDLIRQGDSPRSVLKEIAARHREQSADVDKSNAKQTLQEVVQKCKMIAGSIPEYEQVQLPQVDTIDEISEAIDALMALLDRKLILHQDSAEDLNNQFGLN